MTAPLTEAPPRRDRVVLAAAVAAVLLTSSLVVFTLLKAERDGTAALQRLQQSQVQQLARSQDARVKNTFVNFGKFVGPLQLTARVGDKGDQMQLAGINSLLKNARTGFYIVDATRRLANGTLLRNGIAFGTKVDRRGLQEVLSGEPAVLGVAPGLTTAQPTVAYAYPLRQAGAVVGAFVFEADVSTAADFSAEVSQLKAGRTGDFSFIDADGLVIASSDVSLLGKKLTDPVVRLGAGFHRSGDRIGVIENVPSAKWRAVFTQDTSEFEGALTGPLKSALVLIVLAGTLAAGVGVVLLARRLRAAREEQRRLEEVSAVREEFISIVSHELRTPVAGLLGFLQTTLDHWDGMVDSERQRAIGRSLSSARRLHALTRDVLDTGSLEGGGLSYSFATTDLREEVGSAVLATQDLLPDRTIRLSVPDDATWVNCDRERITQVMTNFLDNAVKSAPAGPIDVAVSTRDGLAVVSVADEGPGMSETELARVFDKFVRGRTSTPAGTGLGLYISKQIITAHGGEIDARSEEGRGATVSFSLPMTAAPAESARA